MADANADHAAAGTYYPYLRQSYAERGLRSLDTGVQYNDLPAVAYAIAPDLYEYRQYHVRIATHDEITRGQTVADVINRWGRPANARVLLHVQAAQLADLFTTRVMGYAAP